jgi:HK97 family phage prohead protease
MTHPTDNLLRAAAWDRAASIDEDADGRTMFGHFAVFNDWTEIDSTYEGRFLERIMPGAFADTFDAKGDTIRVLYDHGRDPQIGNKPLGQVLALREDERTR